MRTGVIILGLVAAVAAFLITNPFRSANSENQLLRRPEHVAKQNGVRQLAPSPAQQRSDPLWNLQQVRFEAFLESNEDDQRRARLLAELFNQWPDGSWAEAATWVQGIADEKLQTQAARQLLPHLLTNSPLTAAQLVLSLSAEQARHDLLGVVMTTWADADWQGALGWARELPGDRMKEVALIHLSYRWLETNPGEALAFAQELASENTQLLTTLASQWAAREPANAAAWASDLSQPEQRIKVLSSVLAAWAQTSPIEAAHFVAHVQGDDAQLQALISVVSSWSGKDPQTLASWITQFPETALREHAIDQLVTGWATQEPLAVERWLQDIPDAPSRDAGVTAYSQLLAATYPEEAFRWAETIANDFTRNRLLQLAGLSWLKNNRAAAQDAIAQSTLPGDIKSVLLAYQ